MSEIQQPTFELIAVDPAYRVRDVQFWYSDCAFADAIRGRETIELRVAGLGTRTLTHAQFGEDNRITTSFTLPSPEDRRWWVEHRGEHVRLELLSVGDEMPQSEPAYPVESAEPKPKAIVQVRPTDAQVSRPAALAAIEETTLCIGLDVAWFGGSKGDRDSQYDCIASVILDDQIDSPELTLTRVSLGKDRDPAAERTLVALQELVQKFDHVERIVFALDAPIQARERDLPDRQPSLAKGQKGQIERRACEVRLDAARKVIDKNCAGSSGWRPNIQSGAPLAPRVQKLLAGLSGLGFQLWTPKNSMVSRFVIECFPAEAIWAAKCMDGFRHDLSVTCAKAYKKQKGCRLEREQVEELAKNVLHAFSTPTGNPAIWNQLTAQAIQWMLDGDATWVKKGVYRGGKLLDDVVDTMICLATALSYSHGCAHVWFDSNEIGDGHIIGPGFLDDGRWAAA